ncbi:hypothetical protein GCM10023257_04020 [Streptomyces hyderabadensis]|uniref:Uncharacterized protein n=1 Tax=Streptomyces hyderabadensis TaxID=598549 RepID=A0ABP9HI41_9ACTN
MTWGNSFATVTVSPPRLSSTGVAVAAAGAAAAAPGGAAAPAGTAPVDSSPAVRPSAATTAPGRGSRPRPGGEDDEDVGVGAPAARFGVIAAISLPLALLGADRGVFGET